MTRISVFLTGSILDSSSIEKKKVEINELCSKGPPRDAK